MRLKQPLIMGLLVVVPLALLAWLGARLERAERENVARTYDELLRSRLLEVDRTLSGLLEERGRAIEQALIDDLPDATRRAELYRSLPWLTQIFAQNQDGRVEVPALEDGVSSEEHGFLERCRPLFDQKLLLTPPADAMATPAMKVVATAVANVPAPSVVTRDTRNSAPADQASPTNESGSSTRMEVASLPLLVPQQRGPLPLTQQELDQAMQQDVSQVIPMEQQQVPANIERLVDRAFQRLGGPASRRGISGSAGWYPYYWGHDVRLLYLVKTTSGGVRGAELSRSRLIADLIGRIPEPAPDDAILREGSMLLLDGGARPLYRWGRYLPAAGAKPRLQVALSAPLQQWSIQYFVAPGFVEATAATSRSLPLLLSLAGVAVALSALAVVLYRDQQRELLEAAQRVTFVNQVSHELKTPLTNIRLHAELLEQELPEDDEDGRRRIGVVISESQRLGRLIGNVLTFSRQQRGRMALRRVSAVPDDTVRQVLERFAPAFNSLNLAVTANLRAGEPVQIDPDALEQILNNLLSNVEKYAARGGAMLVSTRVGADRFTLVVCDRGQGIPSTQSDYIFQPFARLHDDLTEGVSGAGIGLSISRELARRHGGDLRLAQNAEERREWCAETPFSDTGGACFVATLAVSDAAEEKGS